MKNKNIGIVWIRDDFRIKRNIALYEATKNHDQVVALFLFKDSIFKKQQAQTWWLYQSIKNFKKQLGELNINLEVVKTNTFKIFFDKFFKKKNISFYWNRVYEPDYLRLDNYLNDESNKNSVKLKIFKGNSLNEINEIKKNDGTPFKVFTPYWKNAEKYYLDKIPSRDKEIKKCVKKISYFKNYLDCEQILPEKKCFKKFEKIWIPSEANALKELKNFITQRVENYSIERNIPGINGTSKLSPFIKFGQIHVETIWEECIKIKTEKIGIRKFLAEIGWREFNHSLINYFPNMINNNYSKKFDKFPWINNSKFLTAWKKGLTGYPIVDAGMRELYYSGWMHNRVRMIVGSFLVKHLLINWKEGEKYFRYCLLDYSKANNVCGWQWVAGSGADAAPYFRIFNPILQGEKFDSEGTYVKRWVPELKDLPKKLIHKPWEYFNKNFKLGKDYPFPIVKHEEARTKALNAFKKI